MRTSVRGGLGLALAAIGVCLVAGSAALAQQGFSVSGGSFGTDSRSMFNLFGSQGSTRGLGMMSSSVTSLDGHTGYFAAGSLVPFVTGVVPVVGEQRQFLSSGHLGPQLAGPQFGGRQFGGPPLSTLQDRIARLEGMGEVIGAKRASSPAAHQGADEPLAPAARNTIEGDASSAVEAVDSIASIRRQRQAAQAEAYRVAAGHFAQAAEAERAGKTAVATYHYKIAHRDGDETIRRQSQARLAALAGGAK